MQEKSKKVAVQMKDEPFHGSDSISANIVLIGFRKRVTLHDSMKVLQLDSSKSSWLFLPLPLSRRGWSHRQVTQTDVKVPWPLHWIADHLFRWYVADAVAIKPYKEIRIFKRGSLTQWDLSQKLWDLSLGYCGVCNERILRGFFT